MSEEYTQVKISMPLIDNIELQRIDTFYNDIVEEYTKAFVKEKEQVILQRVMKNLQQENSQLKEDIKFCLHSIKQEKEMSTDSRTRKEMETCYEILERWNK